MITLYKDFLYDLKKDLEKDLRVCEIFFCGFYENADVYYISYCLAENKMIPIRTGGIDGIEIKKSNGKRKEWNTYGYELLNGSLSKNFKALEIPDDLKVPKEYVHSTKPFEICLKDACKIVSEMPDFKFFEDSYIKTIQSNESDFFICANVKTTQFGTPPIFLVNKKTGICKSLFFLEPETQKLINYFKTQTQHEVPNEYKIDSI